jgi:hypothetical protein
MKHVDALFSDFSSNAKYAIDFLLGGDKISSIFGPVVFVHENENYQKRKITISLTKTKTKKRENRKRLKTKKNFKPYETETKIRNAEQTKI